MAVLPVVIPLPADLDAQEFLLALGEANPGARIEQTELLQLTMTPPAGFESSEANNEISTQLRVWSKQEKRGRTVDSSTLFVLPDGGKLGPITAWISEQRLAGTSAEERKSFLSRVPEFVVELRSETDRLPKLQQKMTRWLRNGVLLGWLVDPKRNVVEIYRLDRDPETVFSPSTLTADGPVAGFTLDCTEIWTA